MFKRFGVQMHLMGQMIATAPSDGIDWDDGLAQRARGGGLRAFERLYRAHIGAVYGLCLRLTRVWSTADDYVQEAFIKTWRALPCFETRRSFRTRLRRVPVNVVLGRWRKVVTQPDLPHSPSGAESAIEELAQSPRGVDPRYAGGRGRD